MFKFEIINIKISRQITTIHKLFTRSGFFLKIQQKKRFCSPSFQRRALSLIQNILQMVNRQWRLTHHHFQKHHLKSQGNQLKRIRTQPSPENRYTTYNPQTQRLSSFRESKRYNSKDYEGRIRQRISNHYSSQRLQQKETLEGIRIKLPKIIVAETPIKIQTLSVKKDFVFNFYRKGKCLISRGKKIVENTIT